MTLPNWITTVRIFFLPLVLYLLYQPQFEMYSLGAFLGLILGVTDYLDGYLSRKLHQVSVLGKILDPIADKLFILLIGIYFVHQGLIPVWVMIIILIRELVISDFRLLALRKGKEVAVSQIGKWKAMFQYLLLAMACAIKLVYFNNGLWQLPHEWPFLLYWVYQLLIWSTIGLTLFSLGEYFWTHHRLFHEVER